MEQELIFKYPKDRYPLLRFQRDLRFLLWGFLENMGPQMTERSYYYGGIETVVDESCLRLRALKSSLGIAAGIVTLKHIGNITDHLGMPFTNICFSRSGDNLEALYRENFTIEVGEGNKKIIIPFICRNIPANTDIFLESGVMFRAASLGPSVALLEPGEYNPLRDDGRYVSKFQQSLRSRK
jgi:hypothetical protein